MIKNTKVYQVLEFLKHDQFKPSSEWDFDNKEEAIKKYNFLKSYSLLNHIYVYQILEIETKDITDQQLK